MDGLKRLFGFHPDQHVVVINDDDGMAERLEISAAEAQRSARVIREEAERLLRMVERNPIVQTMEGESP